MMWVESKNVHGICSVGTENRLIFEFKGCFIMQAIILAAGMGKRLKDLTQNNTKCMIKVNGVTLIDRLLHQLETRKLSKDKSWRLVKILEHAK